MADLPEIIQAAAVEVLGKSRRHPLSSRRLQKEIARAVETFRPATLQMVLGRLVETGAVVVLPAGPDREYFWAENLPYLQDRLCHVLEACHRANPYDPGVRASEVKKRFSETETLNTQRNIDGRLFDLALAACRDNGSIVETDRGLRRKGFTPRTLEDAAQEALERRLEEYITNEFCARLDTPEAAALCRGDSRRLEAAAASLVRKGRAIRVLRLHPVEGYRYFAPRVIEQTKVLLTEHLARRAMSTAEIRTLLGHGRLKTIAMLEYLDRQGFTQREGDTRRLAVCERGALRTG